MSRCPAVSGTMRCVCDDGHDGIHWYSEPERRTYHVSVDRDRVGAIGAIEDLVRFETITVERPPLEPDTIPVPREVLERVREALVESIDASGPIAGRNPEEDAEALMRGVIKALDALAPYLEAPHE